MNLKLLFSGVTKKIDFKVANENAWDVGLACGGEISIYIEQINL